MATTLFQFVCDTVLRVATIAVAAFCAGTVLSSREVTLQVLSAPLSLTSVFGMGTGGTSASYTPAIRLAARLHRSAASRRRSLKGLASPLDPGLCRLATTRSSKPSDRILDKECLRHHSLPGPSPSSFRPSDQIPDKECPRHSSISSARAL